jgi:GTPases
VFNKCDLVDDEILPHGEHIAAISAHTGAGLENLLTLIGAHVDAGKKQVVLALPYDKGGVLDMLYREAKVESVAYEETILVTAVVTPKVFGQVREFVQN